MPGMRGSERGGKSGRSQGFGGEYVVDMAVVGAGARLLGLELPIFPGAARLRFSKHVPCDLSMLISFVHCRIASRRFQY